jgi:hypothetical protein
VINYGVIKNAYQAIVVLNPSTNSNPKLKFSQTIIDNAYETGIVGVNTSITAQNLLVSNCGSNIALVNGGKYQFNHCTAVSYSNSFIQHKSPVMLLSDYLESGPNSLDAVFRNCIFWGEGGLVDNEVQVKKKGNPSIQFDNVLWKVKETPVTPTGNGFNQDPLFDSVNTERNFYSFRLKENSPALNKGANTSITLDLDGNPRPKPATLPDLGCYEKQ